MFNAAFGIQGFGRQFEDDLNVRTVPGESEPGLPGYAILDFTASRAVGPNLEFFFGIQNLTDKEYIAFTQPTTTGSPRFGERRRADPLERTLATEPGLIRRSHRGGSTQSRRKPFRSRPSPSHENRGAGRLHVRRSV